MRNLLFPQFSKILQEVSHKKENLPQEHLFLDTIKSNHEKNKQYPGGFGGSYENTKEDTST